MAEMVKRRRRRRRLHPVPAGDVTRFRVYLAVPRRGGLLEWAAVSGGFEQALAAQEGPALRYPHVEGERRRGKDDVAVLILMTVYAADVAQALMAGWNAFVRAAGDNESRWSGESATAQVWPEP